MPQNSACLLDELQWAELPSGARRRVGNALGSSRIAVVAACARVDSSPVVVVVPDQLAMEEMVDSLHFFGFRNADDFWHDLRAGASRGELPPVFPFPHLETLPYENKPPEIHLKSDRLRVFEALSDLVEKEPRIFPDRRVILVAPARALLARMPDLARVRHSERVLRPGAALDRDELARFLIEEGYEAAELVSDCGQFSVRGGIIDIFPYTTTEPVRVELFGDEIESLRAFDLLSQRSRQTLEYLTLGASDEFRLLHGGWKKNGRLSCLSEFLPQGCRVFWDRPELIEEEARRVTALVERMHSQRMFFEAEGEIEADNPLLEIPPASFYQDYAQLRAGMERFDWVEISEFAIESASPPEEINLPVTRPNLTGLDFKMRVQEIARRSREGERFLLVADNEGQKERIKDLVLDALEEGEEALDSGSMRRAALRAEHALEYATSREAAKRKKSRPFEVPNMGLVLGGLRQGFRCEAANLTVVCDSEIFGRYRKIRTRKRFAMGLPIIDLVDLQAGQVVVHMDHGIGRFAALRRLTIGGREGEFLELRYADEDVLYVPIEQIDRVSRYIGADDTDPKLSKLGGKAWQTAKARAKKAIEDLTQELLQLYAARETVDGYAYPPDTPWQHAFEAAFPFDETPDQWKAIQEVKKDMESPRCMDRLICGDVGFGKTEVAMRAAFKAVCEARQVAILAPTTVLVEQHAETFRERMMEYPVTIESVSRFRAPKDLKEVLKKASAGEIDILVGTHRLLQKDVRFKDLGLTIIDEEQRFGVKHKERLKQLRTQVDVLTLSATPIPRTLYMSMSGVRDMSLVSTPPSNRLPIETYVLEFKREVVENAILRELARGGQVFFVHNRVESIHAMAELVQEAVPEARIGVGHGQMEGHELEKVMQRFISGEVDVLVSTTIVESGLDIPNANTILINRADTFGLSELYQLRGRVGRAKHQAYCYLLVPSKQGLTPIARQRLLTLQENTALGSGFNIAMRDLEIRGMGNILGREQHGHIAAIGFDLYSSLLAKAILEMRGRREGEAAPVALDTYRSGEFPADYVPSPRQRMSLHKRLSGLKTLEARARLREEIEDLYGKLPAAAELVFRNLELKDLARGARVDYVQVRPEGARLRLNQEASEAFNPAMVLNLERAYPRKVRVSVQNRLHLEIAPPKEEELWEVVLGEIFLAMADGEGARANHPAPVGAADPAPA